MSCPAIYSLCDLATILNLELLKEVESYRYAKVLSPLLSVQLGGGRGPRLVYL
jgi:hypothetical protein